MSILFIRGIRAFIKYVPRDIVRMMLSGEMEIDNTMVRKTLTIMFMDIVGYTSLCERIRADQLMMLTSQYLEAMCEIIVASNGVLDKVPSHPFLLINPFYLPVYFRKCAT